MKLGVKKKKEEKFLCKITEWVESTKSQNGIFCASPCYTTNSSAPGYIVKCSKVYRCKHIYIYIYIYIGCSSDPMMTFVFYNSSMNMEVAPQPQPRGTKPWTVGALEVSCCDHCRSCSAVSLSGSSEFLASSLFKVGSSSVNQALQFWFVHGISLQVSWIDVAPLEIDFDRVFILQFWSTLISFAGLKVYIYICVCVCVCVNMGVSISV